MGTGWGRDRDGDGTGRDDTHCDYIETSAQAFAFGLALAWA